MEKSGHNFESPSEDENKDENNTNQDDMNNSVIYKYDDNWLLKVLKITKGYNNTMSINILKFIIKL